MSGNQKSWYRPDIDGLRAVAVLAVILFHAQVPGFSGGYVGVDVFFVISGYLITSIIARQLTQGTFSLTKFWERRIRRIVPVLTIVLLTTAFVGYWLILFPLDYLDLGQSLLAQSLFLSNIFFLRKSDYFAGPAEEAPLLHTWSLAIEEQFYLGFPILLLLLWKLGRKPVLLVLGLLLVGSLAWCQYLLLNPQAAFSVPFLPPIWAAADNATAAFYLLPTRAFELLIGALLALSAIKIIRPDRANLAAGLGTGLVLGSIILYSEATLFPGIAALWPTVGAALLILAHTNQQSVVHTVLTAPLVVWVGLLSYSLYLWHWPALVLGKYYFATETLSVVQTVGLLGLTVSLSVLTFYWIENPARTWRPTAASWQVYVVGLVALGTMVSIGYAIMQQNGLPQRAPEAAHQIALAATDFGPDRTRCFVESRMCQFGPEAEPITRVVLGDSHGGAALPAIAATADESGVAAVTHLSPGCSPLTPLATAVPDSTCDNVHHAALEQIARGEVQSVLLVSRWSNYRDLADTQTKAAALFSTYARETVEDLRTNGVDVYVLLQVPHHAYFETRSAFYEAVSSGVTPPYYLLRKDHDILQTPIYKTFQTLEQEGLVTTLDPATVFCNQQTCDFVRDNVLLYQDSNHLNQTGALLLKPLLQQFMGAQSGAVES